MNNTIYNQIGKDYNTTRKADPYIAGRLYELLETVPGGRYLDIGCGTGNYLGAMLDKGLSMTGIDPSETMLEAARSKGLNAELICAGSENIPFPDQHFDGIMAVLTLHHWRNKAKGLEELHRVIWRKARLVFFSYTPEQLQGYWLKYYFPRMIDEAAALIPDLHTMRSMLDAAGFSLTIEEPYFVKEDLQDHFMYSNKNRPEQYLQQHIRDGASAFRLATDQEEIANGLLLLRQDIESGVIHQRIAASENQLGDYLFLQATAE